MTTFPRHVRPVSWIRAARKDFEGFPKGVQSEGLRALAIVAAGAKPDIAKPLHGLGAGILELVLNDRTGTYRVVYGVQIGQDIWVLHVFQKKSVRGIATPVHEIETVRIRLKRLKEMLR